MKFQNCFPEIHKEGFWNWIARTKTESFIEKDEEFPGCKHGWLWVTSSTLGLSVIISVGGDWKVVVCSWYNWVLGGVISVLAGSGGVVCVGMSQSQSQFTWLFLNSSQTYFITKTSSNLTQTELSNFQFHQSKLQL